MRSTDGCVFKFNDRELNEQLAEGKLTIDQVAELRKAGDLFAGSGHYAGCTLMYSTTRQGVKFDSNKPSLDLLDPEALLGLTAVLDFGKKKYSAENWRGGISYRRLIAAMLRHTFAIMRGELNDPESNLPHIDHVGCCWMFLSNMMKTRPDMNDLYKRKETQDETLTPDPTMQTR